MQPEVNITGERLQMVGHQTRVVSIQDDFTGLDACSIVSQGTLESLKKLELLLTGQAAGGHP